MATDPLTRAIRRAQQNLLRLQHADGYWCGELFADSTLCSDTVLFMHWADELDPVLEEKCVAHIRRRQLPDGGWNIYEGGPSEVSASVKAYFALKLAGHAPTQPWMQEARACILRLGGIPKVNTYAKLYLALLGQFPWKWLPTVPVEIVFFPRWCFFNIYELSSWSRAMLMPLAILNHYKPTRQLPPEKQLHELYPVGSEGDDLGLHWQRPRFSWPNFFLVCDRMLKALHNLPWKPRRRTALARAEAWMVERMGSGSEGLGAIFPAMLNALIALKTLRYSREHPLVQKAQRDFAGLFVDDPHDFRIQPCLSPVWDTAINPRGAAGKRPRSEERGESCHSEGRATGLTARGGADGGRLVCQESGSRAERLGVRVWQSILSRYGRHDDGADGIAADSPGRRLRKPEQRSSTGPFAGC